MIEQQQLRTFTAYLPDSDEPLTVFASDMDGHPWIEGVQNSQGQLLEPTDEQMCCLCEQVEQQIEVERTAAREALWEATRERFYGHDEFAGHCSNLHAWEYLEAA